MRFGDALHRHEPRDRFLHCRADRQEAVIAQHDGAVPGQRLGDAPPAVQALHLYFLVVEQRVILHEHAGFLGDGLEQPRFCGERRPKGRVRMRRADDIRPRRQNRPVNVVPRPVRAVPAFEKLPVRPDQHHRLRRRIREGNVDVEQPEAVLALRILGADVAIARVAPTERREDPVAQRQVPLALLPQVVRLVHGVDSTGLRCASRMSTTSPRGTLMKTRK